MEKYTFNQAQNEASNIKRKAEELSQERTGSYSVPKPLSVDYQSADEYYPQQKELSISPEQESEIMNEVIDIFSEKDLKLRNDDIISIEHILKRGVISPYNENIFNKQNLDNSSLLKKQRIIRAKEKELCENSNLEHDDSEYRKLSHKGNVFYPEGILNLSYSILQNNFEIKPGETDKLFLRDVPELLEMFTHMLYLITDDSGFKNINISLLKKAFIKKGLIPSSSEEHENIEINEQQLKEMVSEIINNFELIRENWVKIFYGVASGEFSDEIATFGISNGVIFDSKLDVVVSYNYEYPTQATIRDVNNKRHIIGLLHNPRSGDYGKERIEKSYFGLLESLKENAPKEVIEKIKQEEPDLAKLMEDGIRMRQLQFVKTLDSSLTENEQMCLEKAKKLVEQYSIIQPAMLEISAMKLLAAKHKLPLYDLSGNLLWPEEKNNEEVKELISKRDKKSL